MELFISFHTLGELVDAEDITKQHGIPHLAQEINKVTSKLECQTLSAETYDPNPGVTYTL